jgi:multicomponent Na+:H+ antiporter subunit E
MTGFWGQQRRTMRGQRRAARRWSEHWLTHVLTIAALVLVWLALWGEVTTVLLASGILLAVVVLMAFPLPPLVFRLGFHPWSMLVLIGRFAADVVAASVQVSYLALRRTPPSTDVVTVELASDSDLIQHLTALAVSLIPGSLIIDADPDKRTLTVHVLYTSPRSADQFIAEVRAQEQRFLAALSASGTPAGRDKETAP